MTETIAVQVAFRELVYSYEPQQVLLTKWPRAVIKDASDYIHTERIEVSIEGVTDDEFYPFALKEGFALDCLGFQIMMRQDTDSLARCKKWAKIAGLKR